MSIVFLKSTRALNTIKQVTAHVKYIGFRSRELKEKGFFDNHTNNADYKQFIKTTETHPALKHPKSIKVHKLIFSLREKDYNAYKRSGKDYKDLVRATLAEYERTHDIKLKWIANIHEADGHPHCHVVIMGASSEKTSSGRYKRLFFTKDDYAQMKQDFELEHNRDAEYYDVEKIDIEKTMKEIEQGFERVQGIYEPLRTEDIKFEYGKYSDKINIYAEKKRIKSEAISLEQNKNFNNKYFKHFSEKEIDIIRNSAASIGLRRVSAYDVRKEINNRVGQLEELQKQIRESHDYNNELQNLASTFDKREAALLKLQSMSFEDRLNNNTEYIQAANGLKSCNTILKKFEVSSIKDVEAKVQDFSLESRVSSINADIAKTSSDIKKLEDINKILRSTFKADILKSYKTDEFKHMSFDQYTSLRALNEYHGANLSSYQLRDRYTDIGVKYSDIKSKLNEVIDNRNRLDRAAGTLGAIERNNKRLYIIDSRKESYGESYVTERNKIIEQVEYQKNALNNLGVKDKEDLKNQILEHNSNSRYVHDLKEMLFDIKPEYDALKNVNEGMHRSIDIEDKLQHRGFMDLGKGFEQVMKNIARDAEKEQTKAEFQRQKEAEKISERNKRGRSR